MPDDSVMCHRLSRFANFDEEGCASVGQLLRYMLSTHVLGDEGAKEEKETAADCKVVVVGGDTAGEEAEESTPLSSFNALLMYIWRALPDWIYWKCLELVFDWCAMRLALRSKVLQRLFRRFDWVD